MHGVAVSDHVDLRGYVDCSIPCPCNYIGFSIGLLYIGNCVVGLFYIGNWVAVGGGGGGGLVPPPLRSSK